MSFIRINKITDKRFTIGLSMAAIGMSLLLFFQNCGPQAPACASADESGSIVDNCATDSAEAASLDVADDESSPFASQGSESYPLGSVTTGTRNDSSSSSGTSSTTVTNGIELARNCTSTGCPASAGFTFQYFPKAINTQEGKPATLKAVAVNNTGPTVKYQWFKNGVAISGKTSTTLNFYPLLLGDGGNYFVRAFDTDSAGSVIKTIESLPVKVTVIEVIIDCAATRYGYNSIPLSTYVDGVDPAMDQWNPPGHKYFLAVQSTYPNSSAIPITEDTLRIDWPTLTKEGSISTWTCAQIRAGAPKVATRLGINACGNLNGWGQSLEGKAYFQCVDGKHEYIRNDCTCVCAAPNGDCSQSPYEGGG